MPLELPESWKPGGDGYLSRDVAMEDADIARDVAPSREETGKNNSKPSPSSARHATASAPICLNPSRNQSEASLGRTVPF